MNAAFRNLESGVYVVKNEVEIAGEPMKEQEAARFGVSLPADLLRDLDQMTGEKGYDNRSLAIADMIRAQLAEHRSGAPDEIVAGTVTLLYDHHKRQVQPTLTDVQHDSGDLIISTLHVHLDHDNCLEVLVVRGRADKIRALADALIAVKGVKHGQLTISAAGEECGRKT